MGLFSGLSTTRQESNVFFSPQLHLDEQKAHIKKSDINIS